MICPKCHTPNDDTEKFCKNCGFQLNSSRICPTCGLTNDSNSKYCKECGTELTPVNTFRKQIIEENTKKSFFSMYKIPIICALVIILAIGAVTGMAFYSGNSGGDDGVNSFIPTDNNTRLEFNEPIDAKMQEKAKNLTEINETNNTNSSKTLTEKVENKTNQIINDSKTLTEKVENKTKEIKNNITNQIKDKTKNNQNKGSSSSQDSSKAIADKTDKSDAKTNTNPSGSSSNANSDSKNKIPIGSNETDDVINESNDTDSGTNDTDSETNDTVNETNDTMENNQTEENNTLTEIEMADVPNLAQKISQTGYSFSTIEYQGNEYTKAQCIYILSEYLLNVDKGKNSPIKIKDVNEASNPSGDDSSQTIKKSDYLSIANRVHSWMGSQNTVPNYVGVSKVGAADLSPNKMLKLFTQATLDYSVSEQLPESVEI